MNEKLFWELIDELEKAAHRQGYRDCYGWETEEETEAAADRIEAVKAKLQEWFDKAEEHTGDQIMWASMGEDL